MIQVKISRVRFKEAAANHPAASLAALLNTERNMVAVEVRPDMPKDTTIKRAGQRIRRKNFPAEPSSAQNLILEGEWQQVNGENWIISENTSGDNLCIILATKSNIRYLKQSPVWYADGTFDVSPKIFYQMYAIHSPVMGRVLPLVYCLLSNKTSDSYKQIFEVLNDKMGGNTAVQKFRPDFEKAPILEFLNMHPNGAVELCFFHFAQANWRKVQQLGLSTIYLGDH